MILAHAGFWQAKDHKNPSRRGPHLPNIPWPTYQVTVSVFLAKLWCLYFKYNECCCKECWKNTSDKLLSQPLLAASASIDTDDESDHLIASFAELLLVRFESVCHFHLLPSSTS
jgi:hypothetical protein